MDAGVSNHLGDSISVTLRAGGPPVTIMGFIRNFADDGAIEGVDPIREQWKAKIDKAELPGGPDTIRRLTAPMLTGYYRPAADTIDDDGNAWLFDLQKSA